MAEVVCAEYTHARTHTHKHTHTHTHIVQNNFVVSAQISSTEYLSALELCTQLKQKVPVCRSSVQRETHFPRQ
jgi:hypothetical protein